MFLTLFCSHTLKSGYLVCVLGKIRGRDDKPHESWEAGQGLSRLHLGVGSRVGRHREAL